MQADTYFVFILWGRASQQNCFSKTFHLRYVHRAVGSSVLRIYISLITFGSFYLVSSFLLLEYTIIGYIPVIFYFAGVTSYPSMKPLDAFKMYLTGLLGYRSWDLGYFWVENWGVPDLFCTVLLFVLEMLESFGFRFLLFGWMYWILEYCYLCHAMTYNLWGTHWCWVHTFC